MTRKAKFETREQWLMAAVEELRPMFKQAGSPLPKKLRFTVSFPTGGTRSKKVVGQHFPVTHSKDGTHEMLVHIRMDDPYKVVGILTHELVHAALPPGTGHGPAFKKLGLDVGLAGKPTHMGENPEFNKTVTVPMLKKLGRYPHAALNYSDKTGKKQSTRLIKCTCPECGYVARVTSKWITDMGPPICPVDEVDFEVSV